ncbi:uncharacterized protein LOC144620332 [Crassostrea virginica]
MVGASELDEIPFGFTADGLYQIILRPMRGPLSGFHPRTPRRHRRLSLHARPGPRLPHRHRRRRAPFPRPTLGAYGSLCLTGAMLLPRETYVLCGAVSRATLPYRQTVRGAVPLGKLGAVSSKKR